MWLKIALVLILTFVSAGAPTSFDHKTFIKRLIVHIHLNLMEADAAILQAYLSSDKVYKTQEDLYQDMNTKSKRLGDRFRAFSAKCKEYCSYTLENPAASDYFKKLTDEKSKYMLKNMGKLNATKEGAAMSLTLASEYYKLPQQARNEISKKFPDFERRIESFKNAVDKVAKLKKSNPERYQEFLDALFNSL